MIALERVDKVYGRRGRRHHVLHEISLDVPAGEIAAVIGPSGAGKSSLSRVVSLLETPTSGSVEIGGRPMAGLSSRELRMARREIGTIFQASSLLLRRDAAHNVALPLEFAGIGRAERRGRTAELLERVGLAEKAGHHPRQLSGGQRQRVGIARALALRPKLLVADEATSGLDPAATRSILDLLQELNRELGLTILLITHEMEVVRRIAHRVFAIEEGRIVESGTLRDLVHDAGSRLSRQLLPDRAIDRVPAGHSAWHVVYQGDDVPDDWVQRLRTETGLTAGIRSGTIEEVDGCLAGRVTIVVDGEPDWLPARLAEWGLQATAAVAA
jgi:ABC-type methionine transport system ATPase subunit